MNAKKLAKQLIEMNGVQKAWLWGFFEAEDEDGKLFVEAALTERSVVIIENTKEGCFLLMQVSRGSIEFFNFTDLEEIGTPAFMEDWKINHELTKQLVEKQDTL